MLVVAQIQIEAGLRDVLIGGSRQLTATPRTGTGIAVPGKTITWSSANPGVATVDQAGEVRGVTQGTAIIRASVDGVTGQVTIDVRPVPVASVTVTLGAATLVAGETTSAQAAVFDSIGGALGGRTVVWSSSDLAVATVSPAGVVTAVAAGPASIIATSEGRAGQAALTVQPRSAVKLGFIAQPTQTMAGAAIAPPVQVAFQDGAGATAAEATGTITLAFSANPTGTTLGGTLSATAVAGVAAFADLRIQRAGQPYSLQATAAGVAAATSSSFAVTPAAAALLAITTAPAGSAASGTPLAVQPVIEVRDAFGNPVTTAGVTISASIASGSGTLGGVTTAVTGANGRATFVDLAIVGAVGSYTLRFQAPGLTEVISSPIAIGAGGATQLTFNAAPPATATNAQPLSTPVRVQLRDGTGNPVAQIGVTVTASLASGAGVLSGTLTGVTAANGEAVFSDLLMTGVVGTFSLRFAAVGLTPAVSNLIALAAGPEHSIGFITPPPLTAINGAGLSVVPVVQLRDISGNAVAKAGVAVQVSVQTPVTGQLQGVTTRPTDAQGQVSFSGLSILGQVGPYVLTFRSGSLSEAIAPPLQLQPGAAAALALSTALPAGAQSGVPFAPQPVVQVVDQSGNAVATAGLSVVASLASGPGLLGGTLAATTGAGGAASYSGLMLTGATGAYTIRFTATGLPALVSPTVTVGAGAATQVTFTTAPPASAQNGVAIAPAVVVQLRDGVGNPAAQPGVTVTASLNSGPGALGGTLTGVTTGGGTATFSNLVITGVTGAYVLQFTAPGLTTAVANPLTLTPGAATQLTFTTAPPATATNGVDLAPPIEVQLRDLSGNPVAQAGVSVSAAIANGAGAVLSGPTPVATGAGGDATFSALRLTGTTGSFTLAFSAAGVSTATSNAIVLQAGAATALAMTTQPPPSTSSGAVLSPQPAVRLVDQSGNLVATTGTTVTASLASGPGTIGGTLVAATAGGVATFTNLSVTGTTGTYTIQFAAPGVASVVSGTIGVGAGAAAALQFVGAPATTAVNAAAITPAVTVRLVDGSSNPVAQGGVVVNAVLASGAGTVGGTTSAVTDGAGVASFANLVLTGTVGNYALRFDVSGITSVTTAPIALSAGAATQLGITTQPPTTATNGVDLAGATVVQLRDVSGNAVPTAGVSVTAVLSSGSGVLSGTLTVQTVSGGSATFADLRITGSTGSKILGFSSSGVAGINSAAVSLVPGAATKLFLSTAPGAAVTNTSALSPQPVIQLRDQSDNDVSQAGVSVTTAFGTTPGASSLGGTTTLLTDGNGRATFTNLAISGTAGGYTLLFSSTGLTAIGSGTITVSPGAATQVLFSAAPPASSASGATLAPPIAVRRADATGNTVTTAGLSVTVAIASGTGGTLTGTLSQLTDGTGSATFADLVLTGPAGTFTLAFSEGALTPATSAALSLTAGTAAKLAFITAPPGTAANADVLAPPIVVQVRDASDNPVATGGIPITGSISSGAGGVLSGTLAQNTVGADATFNDLAITGSVGNYTLQFTSPGLAAVTAPAPLALTAGAAAALGFAVAPPGAATSGVALAPQPEVQVLDQSGNPVSQGGLLVTATTAGGTVTSATATTSAGGLATFAGLAITGAAGNYVLDFDATGFGTLSSSAIAVTAGAATQMAFIAAPPGAAVNGELLSPQPVVELRDGTGNPVLVAGTSVTVSRQSGSGLLAGTTTVQTDGSGRATFTDLELQGSPGAYVLDFDSGVLPTLSSGTITLAIGPAEKLVFQAAPPASTTNGLQFGGNTVVALTDVTGNVVPTNGVSVTVAIATGPGATLGGTTTRTTASGLATFDDLVLTGTAGNYTLDFTSGTLTKATSNTIALQPGAVTQLFLATAPPASGSSGAALAPAVVVQLRDASNNNVAQSGVTVDAAIFSPTGNGAVLGGNSVTTDVNGRATFSTLAISGPVDTYRLAFTSGTLPGLVSAPIAIAAGTASKLAFITTPSTTATNGAALAQQPTVEVRDAADNPVLVAGTPITVAVGTGSGTLTGTQLVVNTLANGRATFAGLTITGTAGVHTLEFSGTGLATLVSASITVSPGPADAVLMVNQPPAAATSTVAFSADPSVRLVDSSGNHVLTAGASVTVALLPSGGGATLGGTLTQLTDGSGTATFPGLSITGPGGIYQLEFSSGALAKDTSSTITVTAATKLAVAVQPSATAQDDSVFAQQPQVQVQDAGSSPVALAGITVTASISSGAGTLLGTLTAVTDGTGLATFTDLRIQGLVGIRQLQFAASGLAAATSGDVTLTPGDPAAILITTQPPATATNTVGFGADPVVRLTDGSGNNALVASTSVVVSLLPSGGGATLGGTLTQLTDASGIATFTGLSISGAAGNYQLAFSSGALKPDTSTVIAMTAATQLSVTTQPSAAVRNNEILAQQPAIQLLDAGNAPVAQAGVVVTVAKGAGTGSLLGTLTATTDGNGLATFTGLGVLGTVGTWDLDFSAPGVAGVSSASITVSAGTATALAMVTQPQATTVEDEPLTTTPAVKLVDVSGNDVDSSGVSIAVAPTPAGAALGGTTSQATDGTGAASFAGLSLGGTAGSYFLDFSGTSLTGVQSTAIALVVPDTMVVTVQPAATAVDDALFTTQPTIRVDDAGASPMAGVQVTVDLVTISGAGTLVGTTVVTTGGGGLFTWADLKIQTAGGTGQFRLRFRTANGAETLSDPIDIP